MNHSKYLIIGGGIAADAAARGIRSLDADGSITLVTADDRAPYARPALSKALWNGASEADIDLGTKDLGITLHTGTRIRWIDTRAHLAFDHAGAAYRYDRVLLATGAAPRRDPSWDADVPTLRSYEDYRTIRLAADAGCTFAVIGGGFLGSELTAALRMNGNDVTWVFPQATPLGAMLPHDLGQTVRSIFASKGVRIRSGVRVSNVTTHPDGYLVQMGDGSYLQANAVVSAIGAEPQTGIAQVSGITCDNGVLVDEHMETDQEDVFAAGDIARFYAPSLNRWVRIEHEDAARTTGYHAGRAMAGSRDAYDHLPLFYSDLFDVGYEGVGLVNAGLLRAEPHWDRTYVEGQIDYLEHGILRGVLAWNAWGRMDTARARIHAGAAVAATTGTVEAQART